MRARRSPRPASSGRRPVSAMLGGLGCVFRQAPSGEGSGSACGRPEPCPRRRPSWTPASLLQVRQCLPQRLHRVPRSRGGLERGLHALHQGRARAPASCAESAPGSVRPERWQPFEATPRGLVAGHVKMGTARVNESLCFSFNGRTCGACYRACPLAGIAMKIGLFETPTRAGRRELRRLRAVRAGLPPPAPGDPGDPRRSAWRPHDEPAPRHRSDPPACDAARRARVHRLHGLRRPWQNYKLAHNHRRLVELMEGPSGDFSTA